jgi:hypothetical protein
VAKDRAAANAPPLTIRRQSQMTGIEERFMTVVQSSLREIARQLKIMNRLEQFRLTKEYPASEVAIRNITEDKQ